MKIKNILFILILNLAIISALTIDLYADETSELILKLLIKKGIVTQEEIDELKAEMEKEEKEVVKAER